MSDLPLVGATSREYVEKMQSAGIRVVPGSQGTYWTVSGAVIRRLPTFHTAKPDPSEVDEVLRSTGSLVAAYLTEPDDDHAANAWLYLCASPDYSLGALPAPMRRNLRRASHELNIAPLTAEELLAHGARAFCDTRRRTGLDDGTRAGFRNYFTHRGRLDRPGRFYLGAWRGDQLAAFLTVLHLDDWVELGSFSMDATLRCRPNDALLYTALSHYIGGGHCRVASFGLSSLQARSNVAGLHRFKKKVGFHPRAVHRAFVLHPSARPFSNRLTLSAAHCLVNGALWLRPRDRRLKKLGGVLACMRGATWMMQAAERDCVPRPSRWAGTFALRDVTIGR